MASLTVEAPRVRRDIGTLAARVTGIVALAGIIGCGLRIATAATVSPRYLVPSGRRTGYPLWMRGPLHPFGTGALPVHGFVALMAGMLVAWLAAVLCARWLPVWVVATSVVIATAVFAVAPPLLSTDVFNYIAYGQMGTHGINPYLHGPAVMQGQPVYGYTGHLWKNVPSAYGPLFTLFTYALAPLGVAGAFWALKAITAAAALATAWLLWATAKRMNIASGPVLALVALNPLVLVYAVGGAHNDVLMTTPLAAALYFAVAKRPAAAGAAVVTAIAIKLSAGIALPFVLLGARPRKRALAGAAVATVVLGGVALLVFGTPLTNMGKALAAQQHFNWIVVSVPSFIGHYLHLGKPDHLARQALMALAAAVAVVMLIRARGGRGWIAGAAVAMLVLLATTAWVLPWYIVWALPFAALTRRRALPAAAILVSVLLLAMQLDHYVLTHHSHHKHLARHGRSAITRASATRASRG